jgi:Ankyrin repeats (3 copies)
MLLAGLCLPLFAADPPSLLDAAKKGQLKEVEALLAGGANLEMKDRDGRTPLMLAAQSGRTSTVELLLSKGAKPDTRDSHGWNAYMLALLSPSGGVVHTTHDAVLKLLPPPKRFRLQANAGWSPGKSIFSSCFMRPADMAAHIREIRPDALVLEALQRFATTSGRDLIALVRADARGTSEQSNLAPAADADATLDLFVEPGAACVQGVDSLTLVIHAQLALAQNSSPILEKAFGTGVKTGMKTESANNPNQHAPLYAAWAKGQAGAIYWSTVESLLLHEW